MPAPPTNAHSAGTEGTRATLFPVTVAVTPRLRVTSNAGLLTSDWSGAV